MNSFTSEALVCDSVLLEKLSCPHTKKKVHGYHVGDPKCLYFPQAIFPSFWSGSLFDLSFVCAVVCCSILT